MGFSRQESWSGLPFPSLGNLPNPGIEPGSPELLADTLPSEPRGKPPGNSPVKIKDNNKINRQPCPQAISCNIWGPQESSSPLGPSQRRGIPEQRPGRLLGQMERGALGSATTVAPTAKMWQPETMWTAPARATSSGKAQVDKADANDQESPTSIHSSPLFPASRIPKMPLSSTSQGERQRREGWASGFPGGSVVQNPPAHAGDHGFYLWSWKFLHTQEQASLCATTTEPVYRKHWAVCTPESTLLNKRSQGKQNPTYHN